MSAFARQIRAGFSAIMPVAAPGMPSVAWVEQAFGLTLYAAQRSAIFAPERYAIIEASTKSGKTVGSLIWLTERVLQGRPGQNFWWVAPIRDQAKLAFRRLKRALPPGHYLANESELTVTLDDRVLWFKGGDHPDSLYGEDVYAAVIDEASRLKEEAWHAVRSTLTATRGPVRMIGNVKGRKNWFYKLARTAESGADLTMHYAKITAHDAVRAGILDADEIADARQKLPGAVYRELYEAEPSDDQGNPFGLDAIRACLAPGLSAAAPVVWGWDLAKSVDFTVGIALDGPGASVGSSASRSPGGKSSRPFSVSPARRRPSWTPAASVIPSSKRCSGRRRP